MEFSWCSSDDGEANYNTSDAGESAEDQHGHDTAEEQEREVQASQPPPRRQRERTVAKWPDNQIQVEQLTEDGMPTEKMAARRMRKLAGMIARQRVSLLLSSFDALSEADRDNLFKECVLPSLVIPEPLRAKAMKRMMKIVSHSWRTHKSVLVRNYVRKGLDATVKYPYISPQDWENFVRIQESDEAKEKSGIFKGLRALNKHDHTLGTSGYDGAAIKWAKQDRELARKGISNPWHKYPAGRPRSYLRGHGTLDISPQGSVKIKWVTKSSAERVSQQVVEKQAELESSGLSDIWVRDKDVLSQVLGTEQTGRMRGFSSYRGWKHWPKCSNMYRKRKRSEVDMAAIKEEIREEVTYEVTRDVIAKLREKGLDLSLPSDILRPIGANHSSFCSKSTTVCSNLQSDIPAGDLVTEPTYCKLVSNPGGYQVEVARGQVFPQQSELNSVPVQDGYVVVEVDFVYPEHESFALSPPPSDEITTLGEALFGKVQWRKGDIVISPKEIPSKSSLEPTQLYSSAKNNLKDFVCNVSSSQDDKTQSAPAVGNCASKDHAAKSSAASKAFKSKTKRGQQPSQDEKANSAPTEGNCASKDHTKGQKQTKSCGPARSATDSTAPKSTKWGQQVGVKQQQLVEPTKSSTSSPEDSMWTWSNSLFEFGKPMLSEEEVVKAGPWCAALHAHYMNACAEKSNTGIIGRVQRNYFYGELDYEPLTVLYEDLFDLLTLDALDVSILRVITLYLIVVAREKSLEVGLLDPNALSISSLRRNRAYSVVYLERCLMQYQLCKYVMFAYNSGKHWITVVIAPNWNKVLYLDSNRGMATNLSLLKSVIDEAYGNFQSKAYKRRTKFMLNHVPKFPCQQQGLDNTCGFYAAHNMLSMLSPINNVDNSEDLDLTTKKINTEEVRAGIARFIVKQIIEPTGSFHVPPDATPINKDDDQ